MVCLFLFSAISLFLYLYLLYLSIIYLFTFFYILHLVKNSLYSHFDGWKTHELIILSISFPFRKKVNYSYCTLGFPSSFLLYRSY